MLKPEAIEQFIAMAALEADTDAPGLFSWEESEAAAEALDQYVHAAESLIGRMGYQDVEATLLVCSLFTVQDRKVMERYEPLGRYLGQLASASTAIGAIVETSFRSPAFDPQYSFSLFNDSPIGLLGALVNGMPEHRILLSEAAAIFYQNLQPEDVDIDAEELMLPSLEEDRHRVWMELGEDNQIRVHVAEYDPARFLLYGAETYHIPPVRVAEAFRQLFPPPSDLDEPKLEFYCPIPEEEEEEMEAEKGNPNASPI